MKVFQQFPSENATCPVCGTGKKGKCVLVPIDGTDKDGLCEAQPFHFKCFLGVADKFMRYNSEFNVLYRRLGTEKVAKK